LSDGRTGPRIRLRVIFTLLALTITGPLNWQAS
jgi:hypothetical protein